MKLLNRRIMMGTALLGAPWLGRAATPRIYTFGVVPQQAPALLAETWAPALAALSHRSGVELRFATAPDVPTFERRLAAGEYDLAYMNPYHFVVFNERPGYRALARAQGERIQGLMVVHRDSPVRTLQELAGSTLAFPTPAAFAASLLVQSELRRRNIPFTAQIVKSHNSVYRDVALGLYPGGGGVPRTFDLIDDDVRKELRVLWTSSSYTTHAIATHPALDPAVTDKIWQAMAKMPADAGESESLKRIGFRGFERANDADWDDIRRLGITAQEAQVQR
jgi:phosphonate transport system substrate-binding protein